MAFIRFSSFIAFILTGAVSCIAQSPRSIDIAGTVVDSSGRTPLEFVNVTLRGADSAVVRGTVTRTNGTFLLENVLEGRYSIEFRMIGYLAQSIPAIVDGRTPRVQIGTVVLRPEPVKLDEVIVTREKPLMSGSIDRRVYNVDQDMMSRAGSVTDLLQNVPSVQVDVDGTVSLRGSGNVTFMLNGKTTPLLERNPTEILQQMPANSIERIEIITNPSAKFKPDGTAGVINIVQKRGNNQGFGGSLTGNAGNQDRFNGTLRLNFNPGMMNLFGSYAFRNDSRGRIGTDMRTLIDSASAARSSYSDLRNASMRPQSHAVTLGTDLRLSESDKLGISGNLFFYDRTGTERSHRVTTDAAGVTTSDFWRNSDGSETEKEYGFKTSYEHAFPGEDHLLHFEADVAAAEERSDDIYTTEYTVPLNPAERERIQANERTTQTQLSLDYADPMSESSTLEAGYAGDFSTAEFGTTASVYDVPLQRYAVDPARSSIFRMNQTVHAAYGTWKQSLGRFGLLAGLRTEQAFVTSNLVTLDSVVDNSYFSVYPTVHLSHKLAEAWELQLSYSRRVNRPDSDELNPFPRYSDPRNLSAGNPYLLPEYTHSLEFGGRYDHALFTVSPTVYVRQTDNGFTSVLRALDDSTFLTTEENLATSRSGGAEVVVSGSIGDLLNAHLSVNGFYNEIDASNLGYDERRSATSWSGNVTVIISPWASTRIQLNGFYRSSRLTPQGEYSPRKMVNIGVRQDFFDGRLGLVFTVSDLFKTMNRELVLDTPFLVQKSTFSRDSRVIYLGMTWYFGGPPKRAKDEQMRFDESM